MSISKIEENINSGNIQSQALSSESSNPRIKAIEAQISRLENNIQSLAQNKDMDAKTKMEKRQEITKQINELKQQISQIKMEERQQKINGEDSASNSMDDFLPEPKSNVKNGSAYKKDGSKQSALMQTPSMEAIISSDNAVHIAKQTNTLSNRFSNQAKVIQGEIKLDAGRGRVTDSKEEELSAITSKADTAQKSTLERLKKSENDLEEAKEKEKEQDGKDKEEDDEHQ